jgi:hypothetical protein
MVSPFRAAVQLLREQGNHTAKLDSHQLLLRPEQEFVKVEVHRTTRQN